jgi:hypothetical protein
MSETGVSYQPRTDRQEESRAFVRDALNHENEGRFEIDAFRFERYVALGWIRAIDAFPYYELTPNGEEVYGRFFWTVTAREWDWFEDDDDEE